MDLFEIRESRRKEDRGSGGPESGKKFPTGGYTRVYSSNGKISWFRRGKPQQASKCRFDGSDNMQERFEEEHFVHLLYRSCRQERTPKCAQKDLSARRTAANYLL